MSLTLYALDGCPYCEAVMETLDEHELEYDVHWVEPAFSSRNEVRKVSEQRSVPVLEDSDNSVVMADAENIQEYIRTNLA